MNNNTSTQQPTQPEQQLQPREREFPCQQCDIGEYHHQGTEPGGIQKYECQDCGHIVTFP